MTYATFDPATGQILALAVVLAVAALAVALARLHLSR